MTKRLITLACLTSTLLISGFSSANGTTSVTIQISVNLLPEIVQEPQFQNCAVTSEEASCDTDLLQPLLVESDGQQLVRIVPI